MPTLTPTPTPSITPTNPNAVQFISCENGLLKFRFRGSLVPTTTGNTYFISGESEFVGCATVVDYDGSGNLYDSDGVIFTLVEDCADGLCPSVNTQAAILTDCFDCTIHYFNIDYGTEFEGATYEYLGRFYKFIKFDGPGGDYIGSPVYHDCNCPNVIPTSTPTPTPKATPTVTPTISLTPSACAYTDFCLNTTLSGLTNYNGNYASTGNIYNSRIYYTGDGITVAYIYHTNSEWCLSDSLGGDCILKGQNQYYVSCPDISFNNFSSGICPTPTPTPSNCDSFDFNAYFICDYTPPVTPTLTIGCDDTDFVFSVTPGTPVPSPSYDTGVSFNVIEASQTPTPSITATPTMTPTNRIQVVGDICFPILEQQPFDSVNVKVLVDCATGNEYYVSGLLNYNGLYIVKGYIMSVYIRTPIGNQYLCVTYDRDTNNTSSNSEIVSILSIYNNCIDCEPGITPTPTVTPTNTPIPCLLSVNVYGTAPDVGMNNGSLTATTTGSYGSVNYYWSNGQTTQSISGLSAATYSVTVSDNSLIGCSATTTYDLYEEMFVQTNNLTSIDSMIIDSLSPYVVDWGDGNVTSLGVGITNTNYTYSIPTNNDIILKSFDLSSIVTFELSSTTPSKSSVSYYPTTLQTNEASKLNFSNGLVFRDSGRIKGLVSELPSGLTTFAAYYCPLTGSTYDMPSTLIAGFFYSENVISGDTSGLPSNLYWLEMGGFNTVSGDVSGFPTSNIGIILLDGLNVVSGDTIGLPRNMFQLRVTGYNTITGDVFDLPSGLTRTQIDGYNTISGDTADIPSGTTILSIRGFNTISGDTSDLPRNIANGPGGSGECIIEGFNTISGDIVNVPSGTTMLGIDGYSTVYGYVSDLPSGLTYCSIGNDQTGVTTSISGGTLDFPRDITFLRLGGNHYITGTTTDLPTSLYYFVLTAGNSTISGDISGITNSIKFLQISDLNTVSGDVSVFSSTTLQELYLNGNNTVTGNISDLPSSIYQLRLQGDNTVTGYTAGHTWTSTMWSVIINSNLVGVGLTNTTIDDILIDLDNSTTAWDKTRVITLKGIDVPKRTTASDTAYNNLTSPPKNVTITLI